MTVRIDLKKLRRQSKLVAQVRKAGTTCRSDLSGATQKFLEENPWQDLDHKLASFEEEGK